MAINFPNNPAVNDTFTVGGTKFTFTGDKWESGAIVELSSDTTPQLSGELNAGTHNINNVGVITATAFHGDGSNLTGLTDAAANTYGNATAVPQIVVGANGRITGISNVSISGGGGGGGTSIILKDSQSLVGAAGTIDFGTGLSVSAISAGVGTVTGITTSDVRTSTLNVSGVSTFAGITTVTGQTLFSKQLTVSGISSIGGNIIVGHTTPGTGSIIKAGAINLTGPNSTDSNSTAYENIKLNKVGNSFRYDLEFHSNGYSSGDIGDFIFYKRVAQLGGGRTERMRLTGEAGNLTVTGSVTAASFSGDGSGLTNVGGSIPSGGIIIWSGASNAIPTGWYLCDGQNSTPDLRDRFVIGAGSNYAVDATGGSADAIVVSHTHGSGNLQTNNTGGHSHGGNTNDSGNHSHGGGNYITNTTGSHQHRWGTDDSDGANGTGNPDANGGQSWKAWTDSQGDHYHNVNGNSQSEGNHSHNINTNNNGAHQHNMNGDTGSQGSSGTGANLPPYYALCYIMKS